MVVSCGAWPSRWGRYRPHTGSPEAVARLRFPQNVACGFTAPRSSTVASQHCERLQLPVREAQFRLQQRGPGSDLVEHLPSEALAGPAAVAQHLAPVPFHGAVHLEQRPDVPGNAVIGVMAAEDGVDRADLVSDLV